MFLLSVVTMLQKQCSVYTYVLHIHESLHSCTSTRAMSAAANHHNDAPSSSKHKGKKGGTNNSGFARFGLERDVLAGVRRRGYIHPTPVQRRTLPLALAGHDLVVMARTGSGKTLAFAIPVLNKLVSSSSVSAHSVAMSSSSPRACLLSPSRELALQTATVLREIARFLQAMKVVCLVGGDAMEAQFDMLSKGTTWATAASHEHAESVNHTRRFCLNGQRLLRTLLCTTLTTSTRFFNSIRLSLLLYIYIYIYVCVCVCVHE